MKKCTSFAEQKGTMDIQGNCVILAIFSSAVIHLQNRFSDSFNLFCSGDKRLLSESLGNEVDFRYIMNVSPNILAKLRHSFLDERALATMTLRSSGHWKTLVHFFACKKKRPENVFLTIIVNYQKIIQKKLCHPIQQ